MEWQGEGNIGLPLVASMGHTGIGTSFAPANPSKL
jgi:hypothetical protein